MYRQHRPWTGPGDQPVRIVPSGPYFVDAALQIVVRKAITAFTLPKRFATGRADDALRYLDWAASRGANEARAFARVDWTGPPGSGVESGWEYNEAACYQTLFQAAQRNMRVQLVAHTGPHGSVAEMAEHLRRVDELCLSMENALLEVWNEPQQNGGHDLVQQVLDLYQPRTPGWSLGAYDPTPYLKIVQTGTTPEGRPIYARSGGASGQSMDYHSPRKHEWSRCTKDAYEFGTGQGPNDQFSPGYVGPVMLSEPPQVEQTCRDAPATGEPAPRDWRAYGAGAKFFACGATIHGNPSFQRCEIPTDLTVLACVDEFFAGFDDVPTQRYHGYFRGDPPGTDPGSRRYNRWGDDGRKYELCVRPYSFNVV